MYAVFYAFLLWHSAFASGTVHLACDNSMVVDAINKHSIKGPSIHPLQTIFLITMVFDINLFSFWLPSEENIVADAASHHDYKKLANMGLQVSDQPRPKFLRQKLSSFFTNPLPTQPDETIIKSTNTTIHSAIPINTMHTQHQSDHSPTGLQMSCQEQNLRQQRLTLLQSIPTMSKMISHSQPSMTLISTLSSEAQNGCTGLESRNYISPSLPQSSFKLSMELGATKKVSTSKRHSVWHLPPSYDLENLRAILLGPKDITTPTSPASTLLSTPTIQ